ncbi:hypothetical protein VNO77_37378 [Canavalia gladiata]|uniref:Prolamin-like domain-containing protein n=1 Tax=Canavalia gladiata TaxID=3824 RepID=A0AAN9PWP6_CANGL
MARLSNHLILVSLIFTTTMATILAKEEGESLSDCGKYMGSCEKHFLHKLISHKHVPVSSECCYKLVQAGYSCYTRLTVYALQTNPKLKDANWTIVLDKNDKIFNKCDEITAPASDGFLSTCVEKIGTECGAQVFGKLIHNTNITKSCCDKLVKMGEYCHINMAKALIRTPQLRDVNATQFLKKTRRIFHHCTHLE